MTNNSNNCVVYCATKMTGRDKKELLLRANYVCNKLKGYGLTPVSPVLEEQVENEAGALLQLSNKKLRSFWKRDKDLIAYKAHVLLCDEAELKSLGVEREYGYARYCLWKPVVTVLPSNQGFNIADYEDDIVVHSIDTAAKVIVNNWGTKEKRFRWRSKMLLRTLPKWLYRQLCQWR